ncbi:DNA polymerase-3 subunit gamma/tau [Actinopolymorpha cephalotaxi]|uniref:DNA polymerase III subunit gamma/tau n=1 Tax=Actinopolymorpha cephalotaxi TaxID=504797 RepID=A0A1I2MUS9_9ACTN|nr:DNA polymerase-3 subunit gamma/tau [Actinopolymorpha cephalotaxi]SFF95304.1 DNA polymerase-3 subunit gamma/tau [Actinopolymorpha cephalotaxi]
MEAPLALYRRYRPQTYAEVIGQDHVTEPLQQALRNNRVHHAYLFSGPRGCGKTTSARILARCLNCEVGPTPEPCGECQSCRDLARGGPGSIDVIEIDAASHGGVDDARDLRERAFFSPVSSRYKIYIVDEAHMVTTQGFNALLKLVEEPPEHLKFVFATTEPEKVIGTIRSRTHHYPFRLVPPKVLQEYLSDLCEREGVQVEPTVLPLVVRAGAGSVRDTLSVLDQLIGGAGDDGVTYARAVGLLGYTHESLLDEVVDALAAGDGGSVFTVVDKVIESGQDPRRFAEDLLRRLRDLVIISAVPDAIGRGLLEGPGDQAERLTAQAARLGTAELTRAADLVNEGLNEMRGATAPRLHLELICARILLPAVDDSEQGLHARLDRLERRLSIAGGQDVPSAAGPSGSSGGPVGGSGGGSVGGSVGGAAAARDQLGRSSAGQRPSGGGGREAARDAANAERPSRVGEADRVTGRDADTAAAAPDSTQRPSARPPTADSAGSAASASAEAPRPESSTRGPAAETRAPESAQPDGSARASAAAAAAADWGTPQAPHESSDAPPAGPSVDQAGWSVSAPPAGPVAGSEPAGVVLDEAAGGGSAAPNESDAGGAAPGEAASGGAGTPGALGVTDVRRLWPDVLEAVKGKRRFSWVMLSQNAHVADLHGNVLTVALVNAGARDSFTRSGSDELLRQALRDVLGVDWRVEAIIDPSGGAGGSGGPGPGGSGGSGSGGSGGSGSGRGGQGPAGGAAESRGGTSGGATSGGGASGPRAAAARGGGNDSFRSVSTPRPGGEAAGDGTAVPAAADAHSYDSPGGATPEAPDEADQDDGWPSPARVPGSTPPREPASDRSAGDGSRAEARTRAGDRPPGDQSADDRPAGDRFSGDRFSGDRSAGDRSPGDQSTGERSRGGDWGAAERRGDPEQGNGSGRGNDSGWAGVAVSTPGGSAAGQNAGTEPGGASDRRGAPDRQDAGRRGGVDRGTPTGQSGTGGQGNGSRPMSSARARAAAAAGGTPRPAEPTHDPDSDVDPDTDNSLSDDPRSHTDLLEREFGAQLIEEIPLN